MLHGVAQFLGHVLYRGSFAHHRYAVAHTQHEVGRGHEAYAVALYAAHVDAVAVAQMERAQMAAVYFGPRDEDAL